MNMSAQIQTLVRYQGSYGKTFVSKFTQNNLKIFKPNLYSTTSPSSHRSDQVEEVEIPTHSGKLAGRLWGNGEIPIIAIHGWLDNAATFDGLLPHLDLDRYKVLALDLPGHGFSDKHPPGINYTVTEVLPAIIKSQDFFNWPKSTVMGHSMGAGLCGFFASVFPERVERLVMLDFVGFGPFPAEKLSGATRKSVETSLKTFDMLADPEQKEPRYEYVDAVGRAFVANQLTNGEDSVTREAVETLMTRGLRKTECGKFTWTTDIRIRIPLPFFLSFEQSSHYCSQIRCPHLVMKVKGSQYYMAEKSAKAILDIYKTNNENFVYREIDGGGHHAHLNHPETVAPVVNDFLARS